MNDKLQRVLEVYGGAGDPVVRRELQQPDSEARRIAEELEALAEKRIDLRQIPGLERFAEDDVPVFLSYPGYLTEKIYNTKLSCFVPDIKEYVCSAPNPNLRWVVRLGIVFLVAAVLFYIAGESPRFPWLGWKLWDHWLGWYVWFWMVCACLYSAAYVVTFIWEYPDSVKRKLRKLEERQDRIRRRKGVVLLQPDISNEDLGFSSEIIGAETKGSQQSEGDKQRSEGRPESD